MTAFCFDVDGTLTPSRDLIDPKFKTWFLNWLENLDKDDQAFLVSGSDYQKTEEQVGEDVCFAVDGVFSCSGNMLFINGMEEYRHDFGLTSSEKSILKAELYNSQFPIRTGNHIEKRIGAVNLSILGRGATKQERLQYIAWDEQTHEREEIAARLNKLLPRFDVLIAGETGVDITLKGYDKSQVVDWIENRPLIFFGDKCEPGGNDYPLAKVSDVCYNVSSWESTYSILRSKYSDR